VFHSREARKRRRRYVSNRTLTSVIKINKMKKIVIPVFVFAVIILIASSFKTQERIYKNLKILPKDITKPEMDSIMNSYNVALGVKCGFCHVQNAHTKEWNHAADDNHHKRIARQMMTMTDKINKKYFKEDNEGRKIPMVTCYTCHNGRKEPYFMPVVEK
jgi:hypothetical protein